MSLKDPRLLLLLAILGVGVAAVILLGQPDEEQPGAAEFVDDDREDAEDPEAALLAGRAEGTEAAKARGPNAFAEETDLKTLFVAAANYKTRLDAWERIAELLREDQANIDALLELLRPGATTLDRYVARWCDKIGQMLAELGRPGLTALLDRLEDKDPHYQLRIAACLAPFGERAAPAVPRLIDLMNAVDEEPREKRTALYVDVLGRIGPPAAKLLPDLHRWLEEGETQAIEIAAAKALIRIGGPTKAVFQRAIDVVAVGPWHAQRAAIATEIGALGRQAEPMIPELLELSRSGEDAAVQGTAVNLLGMIGIPDPKVIEQLEQDLTQTTTLDAFSGPWAFALSKLGAPGRAALLRAVEAKAPLSAGYAARHLRTARVPSSQIWRMLEPGLTLELKAGEPYQPLFACIRFFENDCRIPAEAAVRLMPKYAKWARREGGARQIAMYMAYRVDKPTRPW